MRKRIQRKIQTLTQQLLQSSLKMGEAIYKASAEAEEGENAPDNNSTEGDVIDADVSSSEDKKDEETKK